MRIDQQQFAPTYDNPLKLKEGSADGSFPLDDREKETAGQSGAPLDSSSSVKTAANVSAALWHISDPDGSSGSTSSTEVSMEGTARIRAMLGGSADGLVDEFMALSHLTSAERIREEYLKRHNMTENTFGKSRANRQEEVSRGVADEIRRQLGAEPS